MTRARQPVWFVAEPGRKRVTLTPWARDILRTNEIPAELRAQFVRELRHVLGSPASAHDRARPVTYLDEQARLAAS